MRVFKPIPFRRDIGLGKVLFHLAHELGRLGLELDDIEIFNGHFCHRVGSDLFALVDRQHLEAPVSLFDPTLLNHTALKERFEKCGYAKPRIEISVAITSKGNLTVRWHPAGWSKAPYDWNRTTKTENMIYTKIWDMPPDFLYFKDETLSNYGRPANELLFIRGVEILRPGDFRPHPKFDCQIVDSILITGVYAAFQGLIWDLNNSFDVSVTSAIKIECTEPASSNAKEHNFVRRAVRWTIG